MKICGSYTLEASPGEVWQRLFDPASLATLIPGCDRLEQLSADEYRGQMFLALPAVSGSFETYVKILEQRPPRYCCLQGEITGPTGIIAGTASFPLASLASLAEEAGRTRLDYEADAVITGGLAKMPARFIEGVAGALLSKGLAKLNRDLAQRP